MPRHFQHDHRHRQNERDPEAPAHVDDGHGWKRRAEPPMFAFCDQDGNGLETVEAT